MQFTSRTRRLATVGLLTAAVIGTTLASTASAGKPAGGAAKNAPATTTVTSDGRTVEVATAKNGTSTAPEAAPSTGSGNLSDSQGVNTTEASAQSASSPVGAESILGSDDRYQYTDTTAYPARATVRLTSSIGQCTGWMIDDDTVATAGHCVFDGTNWASSMVAAPGQNGSYRPYGTCGARTLGSVLGWTRDHNWEFDYGVVKLNCTIGNTVGWYGIRWQSASFTGAGVYTRGYPGDKPATMWGSYGTVKTTTDRKLFYTNDTVGGQSGSPVYDYPNGNGPYGVAVHAYGTNDGGATNSGTRINEQVFNNFQYWKGI